jgi:phage recombination protein Bet
MGEVEQNKSMVVIQTDQGPITLTPAVVRKYLVQGNGAVTDQEIAFFLGLCKYNRLNVWLPGEVFLIKYGSSPATMVVGKGAYLKRAMKIKECQGFRAGVICQSNETKEILRTEGFCPPDCKLIGGWAEVHRENWAFPLKLEVSLQEYIAKTRDGMPNKMWTEKPATMIRKVALVGALREAFPDSFSGLYSIEESNVDESTLSSIPDQEAIDVASDDNPQSVTAAPSVERRRRANKFSGLDKAVYGATELNTCGATPEQLLEIRGYMREDSRAQEMVKRELAAIGYTELSYFRQDEAEEILGLLRPAATPMASAMETQADEPPIETAEYLTAEIPSDLVDCPLRLGDRMSISQYCRTTCPDRKGSGFCPAIGEDPPVSDGAML